MLEIKLRDFERDYVPFDISLRGRPSRDLFLNLRKASGSTGQDPETSRASLGVESRWVLPN